MGKSIELTVELSVKKVSCPGVWLCQDGRVSLTLFALGTSYQTCMLPPVFPLLFRDVFYFRKRFSEATAFNNICCLLDNETIYCELVQWCDDCTTREAIVLAQYLGSINEVLFPSNMCSDEGVDLLMRRAKNFPGILAPKIEVSTKVRIDELTNAPDISMTVKSMKICSCKAPLPGVVRQHQVCHTPMFHRIKCSKRIQSLSRSRSRSASRSCHSLSSKDDNDQDHNQYLRPAIYQDKSQRPILKSQFIDQESPTETPTEYPQHNTHISQCVCQICKKYHELFHADLKS